MRFFRWPVFVIALLLAATAACDSTPAPTVDVGSAPKWVVEANERARKPRPAPDPQAEPQPAVQKLVAYPYLWKVRGTGADSYLLGSFHINTDFQGLDPLPDSVRQAFEASEVVMLEADVNSPQLEPKRMTIPRGNGLRKRLSPQQWDQVVKITGYPSSTLQVLRPWLISSAITAKWFEMGPRGMDGRFIILARVHDKKVEFLESLDEQAQLLDQLTTVDDIAKMLERENDVRRSFAVAKQVFESGTAKEFGDFDPVFSAEMTQKHKRLLFYDRNERWAQRLTPRLAKEGGLFVVVGAGHLVGEGSVPALLAQKGLAVERIDAPAEVQ